VDSTRKIHDALTISLGTMLGSASLYYLHRRHGSQEDNLSIGTLLAALFWASMGTSFLFPGSNGLESEFPQLIPGIKACGSTNGSQADSSSP
jgi:hypothetical protein